MPRYYFDIDDGAVANDAEGTDLPDPDAVRIHAMQLAAAYARAPIADDATGGGIIVTVRDSEGAASLVVRLAFNLEQRG